MAAGVSTRLRHAGGELVRPGLYLRLWLGGLVVVEEPFGRLPEAGSYVRVPLAAALLLGPLVGLAYVLFLPAALPVALVVRLLRWRRGQRRRPAPLGQPWAALAADLAER